MNNRRVGFPHRVIGIMELIESLHRDRGVTIVMNSHDPRISEARSEGGGGWKMEESWG